MSAIRTMTATAAILLIAACNQPAQQQPDPNAPPGSYGENPGGTPGQGGFGPAGPGMPGGGQPGGQGPGGQQGPAPQGFPFPKGGIPMPGSQSGPNNTGPATEPPLSATPPREEQQGPVSPPRTQSQQPAQASATMRCYVAGYVAMELYGQVGASEAQMNRAVEVASAAEERLAIYVDRPGGSYEEYAAQEERLYMEFEQRYQQLGPQRFAQELDAILARCPR